MGLVEKQAINEIQEKVIPKLQNYILENGLAISLKVDWESFPQTGTEAINRCKTVLSEFSNRFWDFGQDKVANEEIKNKVKTLKVKNDSTVQDPLVYRFELQGNEFVFTTNLEIFTVTNSSSQKNFKTAISELL